MRMILFLSTSIFILGVLLDTASTYVEFRNPRFREVGPIMKYVIKWPHVWIPVQILSILFFIIIVSIASRYAPEVELLGCLGLFIVGIIRLRVFRRNWRKTRAFYQTRLKEAGLY